MPARNVIKSSVADSYYHVYARGVAKMPIFLDDDDYSYFRALFARHLSPQEYTSKAGVRYPHLRGAIELLAYCQMKNHFHLLVYQVDEGSLASLMRSVMTAYSRYFNLRHKRSGPLFESRYKAARIESENHLLHISRYIHLNPRYYKHYPHSSYESFTGGEIPDWLQPQRILEMFDGVSDYVEFCEDYVDRRDVLAQVKHELADY